MKRSARELIAEVRDRALQRRDPRWWARSVARASAGLALGAPLALLTPKRARAVAVMGRADGGFSDNAKYLFLHLWRHRHDGVEPVFLTEHAATHAQLRAAGLPALRYPSASAAAAILRARVLVVDNVLANTALRYYLALACKKVQLWHGVGFKRLPRLEWFPIYDLMITTSAAYGEEVFGAALKPKAFAVTGYPRNDVLLGALDDPEGRALAAIGTDGAALERVRAARAAGLRVVLWAPTFRADAARDRRAVATLEPARLEVMARRLGLLFVIKPHAMTSSLGTIEGLRHVIRYHPQGDIYPALPLVDALITDYSSIYMDYLLLDRPVLFCPFDRAEYQTHDLGMLFDYDQMTPGPKCDDLDQLEAALGDLWRGGDDPWHARRHEVRDLAFAHHDAHSAARVWDELQRRFLG